MRSLLHTARLVLLGLLLVPIILVLAILLRNDDPGERNPLYDV